MKYIFGKLKNFLKIVLKYLKAIIVSFFGFFFDSFSNKSTSKGKIKRENNIKSQKKYDNKTIESSGYMEEPTTRTVDSLNFNVSNEELEYLILIRFCKELELKERDLTSIQKEYIKSLNEKIIPALQHDITKQYISNSNDLNEEIKKLVIYELEYQFKLEQNNELPTSKIIITPLLSKKNNKETNLNTKETFLASKRNDVKSETKNTEFIISNNKDLDKSSDINNYMINQSFNNSNDTLTDVLKIEQIDTLFLDDYKSDVPNYDKINETYLDIKIPEIKIESDVYTTPSNNEDAPLNFYEESYNKPAFDVIQNPEIVLNETDVNKKLEEKYEKLKEQPNELIESKSENKNDMEQYDYYKIDLLISNTITLYDEEVKKQEFEDKNYDLIQKQIDYLLNEINKLKFKNLNTSQKEKLLIQENKILTLRNNLLVQKQKDISLEQNLLDASILIDDLNSLEEHLQKLHIEDKLDLQEYRLKSLEELDNLTIDKAKKIEKELLKIKLRKALHSLEIPSLLSLPFIRNKYFMFFTGGLLVNRHLKFFDAILKRKSVDFDPEDVSQIKSGSAALESSLFIFEQNIQYLNYLESEALKKYPELKYDVDYLINLNSLKSKLLRQQERLLKKEKMIEKHNLKLKKKIRKLKKKENQNF
jgi:hypothetical protein